MYSKERDAILRMVQKEMKMQQPKKRMKKMFRLSCIYFHHFNEMSRTSIKREVDDVLNDEGCLLEP